MENATTRSKEGLLETVLPGSGTFDENILTPLRNNYLYEESKECFTYNSAYLINNAASQKRYAAFRAQKREEGYSEQELEEAFGFLLFNDLNKAKKVGETGLVVGQAKCTTLGDSSKGIYVSKYSDCLDLKRWYNGKTGFIVLVKITKGRVKEVTDNYTKNFTPPAAGFDCHVSEHLDAVTSTTSSFLAYERTQYYMYELIDGSSEAEPCPRQACPFAIVAFSYGATAVTSGLEEQRQETTVFRYKPWIGQLKIESAVYDVGLQSVSGAWFPTKLPKTVKIDHAIGVSELKRTLPREIFETCLVGEVCIDGRCFNLYDVVSSKAKNDLAQITQELKEKDLALVIPLDDSGFLILLHSSHLFSYEDARSGKAAALQGMFIFPDSRAVPRDTKCEWSKRTVSTDVIQAIPALNYAETEMEKCPPNQQGAPQTTLEKHLQNYATLIQPGLLDVPTREASMFPDQYDVPSGFTLIAPKWSQETGIRLKSYFDEPCGFTVPVVRALELLAAGRQQRGDEQDDDVYYYISSPEEVPQAPSDVVMEVPEQTKAISDGRSASDKALENIGKSKDEHKHLSKEQPQPALPEGLGTPAAAVVTEANSVSEYPASTVSPKLGDVPAENCVSIGPDDKKLITKGCNEMVAGLSSKETPAQTSSSQLTISMEEGGTAVTGEIEDNNQTTMADPDNKVNWRSLQKRRGRKRKMHWKTMQGKKEVQKKLPLPTQSLPLILAVNSTEATIKDPRKDQIESQSQTETVPDVTESRSQTVPDVTESRSQTETVPDVTESRSQTETGPDVTESRSQTETVPDVTESRSQTETVPDVTESRSQTETGPDVTESRSQTETVPDVTESRSQTETVPDDHINQRPHSTSRGRRRRRKGVKRNLSETREKQAPFKSTAFPTCEPAETVHDQGIKTDSLSPSKKDWRTLPRRKRLWNADVNLKRCLRSDALKNSNNDSPSGESSIDATEVSMASTPKRKMEGLNLRQRYGLKTIITKCGRVFVPHGSDVASEDVASSNGEKSEITNEKMDVETSIDTEAEVISPVENKSAEVVERRGEPLSKGPVVNEGGDSSDSPLKDKTSVQPVSPITILDKHHKSSPSEIEKCRQVPPEKLESMTTTSNEAECLQHTNEDHSIDVQADKTTSPPRVPDQSISTLPKVPSPEKTKKKAKHAVYSAISISKLKTVLRRGKRSKSPSSADGISEPSNAEPEFKKEKTGFLKDLKLVNIRNEELKDKGSQSMSNDSQHTSLSHGSHEPMKSPQRIKEGPVSWRGLINKASKENGSINFHTSAPFETVKQADERLISSLIGDGVGRVSSGGKDCTEKLTTVATLPSDALSLLADLALGASTNKTLTDLKSKPGQETPAGVKGSGSPESVLHALLRCPSTKFKLPPRSPFPEGLLVTGELILEISKEHSYSQPTSLLSGLSGTCPQVCSPSGCVKSPLSLKTGWNLNLPKDAASSLNPKDGGKTEWKCLISPNGPLPSNMKTKTRRSRILRHRRVIEKEGSIQVVRIWRDEYEFKYDSRFTNDNLDKTVMRALHGKWNFDIEDTHEEVHLIFHMWIGLFYSKVTSRLFHLENSTALPKRKDNTNLKRNVDSIQTPLPLLNVELSLKDDLPKILHLSSDILDLSVKNCEPVNVHLVSKQSGGDDTASHPVVASHEVAPKHSPSGTNLSSCPKVTAQMNHRSVVNIQVENVVSDNEDDFREENDIISDCSYTQLLEGNSAYIQLCKKASGMSISVQPHPQAPKVINVSKNVAPPKATSFDPKEIGVFHQVICPIKPSAFSTRLGLVLGRASFNQSFKDETGDKACVVQQKEDVSVNAESKTSFEVDRTKDGCPMSVDDGNVDKTLEFTSAAGSPISEEVSDKDSQDGCLMIVEDEALEENKTSKSSSSGQASVAEHNETPRAEGEFKPSLDLKDHTNECDSCVDDLNSSPETRVEEQNETINAREELEPLEDHASVVDTSSHSVEGNDTKESVEERDESCIVKELQEGQSKPEERTKMDARECEISTTVVEHLDDFDLDLNDNMDSVDMEISDEDFNDSAVMAVYEKNTPSVKSLVSEPINCVFNNEGHDVKMEKSETQPKTPVETNTRDDSPEEIDVSCSGDVGSLDSQTMSVEEKTTSASNNDISEVMQNRSENMTYEQRIVVQEEALDMYDNELTSTSNIESSKSEIRHSENDKESDLGQQDTTGNDSLNENGNENETQSQTSYSCDNKVIDTYQKCQSPQICQSSPSSTANSCDKTVTPQALNKTLEGEVNSTSSTPTQDEPLCVSEISKGFKEVSDFSEGLNNNLHCTNNIDQEVNMLSPKGPVSPHSHECTKMPLSNSIEHCEEIHLEDPEWKKRQYTGTKDLVVKDNFTLPTEQSPNENPDIQYNHKLCPTSQREDEQVNITKSASPDHTELSYRDYDVDDLHGYYHESPSDEHFRWSICKTDGPNSRRFDEDFAFDEDSGDVSYPPIHSVYSTSEVSEGSYELKKKEMENLWWAKKNYTSEPLSTLGDANRKGDDFKCQTKVTYSSHYPSSIDILKVDQIPEKRSRNDKFTSVVFQNAEWNEEDSLSCTVDYKIRKTSCFEPYQTKPTRTVTVNSLSHVRGNKQRFDWRRYFIREAASRQLYDSDCEGNNKFDIQPSSIVTILDKKGNRVTFDNSTTVKPPVDANRLTIGPEDSNHWQDKQSKVDMTQSAVDLEYLIFSEQLNRILKESKSSVSATSRFRSNADRATFPMTFRLSNLNEVESSTELTKEHTSLTELKIKVDLSDRKELSESKQRHFYETSSEELDFRISEISEQCASYRSRMNDFCTRKTLSRQTEAVKRKWGQDSPSQQPGFSGRIRKDMLDNLHDNQECNIRYRFYILVTSADTFFKETKNLLMIEGNIPVEPDEFDLSGNSQSPLLIILKNEDIAEHICEVPYLLELKKSSNVMFAGIDRPDDMVNHTHQELFANGGFIVCDELALDTLTLDNMKKLVGILEEMGKWKWFLHYKDSRKLRESARSSHDASKKQHFIDVCQESGIVEVLPYHDCDVISRGQPDYLLCLTCLQIQNASVRFPVFITDTPTDSFEKNGILTMNIYTFLRILSKDTCSVS